MPTSAGVITPMIPWDIPPPKPKLHISLMVERSGGWLELNQYPYRLAADSFQEHQVSMRKQEVQNPFVDGSFISSATKENVTETLSVYINADGSAMLHRAVKALIDAIEQLTYRMIFRTDATANEWQCMVADYTIHTSQAYMHAHMAQVIATVPRLPQMKTYEMGI